MGLDGADNRLTRVWAAGAALQLAALILASPHDIELTSALYNPLDGAALWIRFCGELPSTCAYAAAVLVLLLPRLRRRSEVWRVAAVTLLVTAILDPWLMTSALKALWGRPRFVQLGGDFSLFTPFYVINRPFAGESFPSGHVAAAAVFLAPAWVLFRSGLRRTATLIACATLVWAAFTGYERMVAGAHYLTDVLFSIGAAWCLAPVFAWLGIYIEARIFRRGSSPPDQAAESMPSS